MKNILILIGIIFITGCRKDEPINSAEILYGKNRFTTIIDGFEREYYVHVPLSYDGSENVPIVFMLHGTSGDGLKFYNISGWKEVGETENILTVYPSSWKVCFVLPDNTTKANTKWNSQPHSKWEYCSGDEPKNDIKFLESIITEMSSNYNIDTKRVYLVGFSNGGEMATKCSISMSGKLAAIVANASSFKTDTTYVPKRKLPVMYQKGANDYGPGNIGPVRPLDSLDSYIATNGHLFNVAANTHVSSFSLNSNFTFTVGSNTSTAIFNPLVANPDNQFHIVMVEGLGHVYPNGKNHWMFAAEEHWQWLKQFSLP